MIGFFIALEHSFKDDLLKDIDAYIDASASYILAMEVAKDKHVETKGQHFHFVGNMTEKEYDSFRKTIIVKKHKRQGVARNGVGRQYGKIGKIRDETKLMSYTCKDNNIIYKNIDLEKIQELIQQSYHKEDRQFPFKELMQYLVAHVFHYYDIEHDNGWITSNNVHPHKIEYSIIQFYIDNSKCEKPLSRATIRSITTKFLMYYTPYRNIDHIYSYIMHNM